MTETVERLGPLPAGTLWRLLRVVSGQLRQVHCAGITHRDLTPNNVMLTADGVRLIDFGVARVADQVDSTRTGGAAGTRGFMAPEQRVGGEVTAKADVYALGALLCYAASGTWPGDSPDVAPLRDIDSELADIVELCLVLNLDARPEAAWLAASAACAGSHTRDADPAWPAVVMERIAVLRAFAVNLPPSPQRRWRAVALAGSAVVVLLAVGAAATEAMSNEPRRPGPYDPPTTRVTQPALTTLPQPSPTPPGTIVRSISPSGAVTTSAPDVPVTPTTAAPVPPAIPTVDPRAYYYIENSGTGSCLSFDYLTPSAGPGQCGSGATTDGWNYYAPLTNGTFEMVNKANGQCLEEQSMNGGVPVVASCVGTASQQWKFGYTNSDGDSFVNVESGLCLAADSPAGSVTIELDSCDKQRNQLWYNNGTLPTA